MKKFEIVDDFFAQASPWQAELRRLRAILTATALTEEVKWGAPCYTFNGKNVVGIGSFKSYFGLWFFQGALLADAQKVLINAQQGKTKAMRQWSMTTAKEIRPSVIKRYVQEAIALVEAGREVKADRSQPVVVPPQLHNAMRRQKGATAAFRSLRRGLQREYADYIAEARREDTIKRRIDKVMPMIIAGGGLHDKYRP